MKEQTSCYPKPRQARRGREREREKHAHVPGRTASKRRMLMFVEACFTRIGQQAPDPGRFRYPTVPYNAAKCKTILHHLFLSVFWSCLILSHPVLSRLNLSLYTLSKFASSCRFEEVPVANNSDSRESLVDRAFVFLAAILLNLSNVHL